jgi:hypothetical protein
MFNLSTKWIDAMFVLFLKRPPLPTGQRAGAGRAGKADLGNINSFISYTLCKEHITFINAFPT